MIDTHVQTTSTTSNLIFSKPSGHAWVITQFVVVSQKNWQTFVRVVYVMRVTSQRTFFTALLVVNSNGTMLSYERYCIFKSSLATNFVAVISIMHVQLVNIFSEVSNLHYLNAFSILCLQIKNKISYLRARNSSLLLNL